MTDVTDRLHLVFEDIIQLIEQLEKEIAFLRTGLTAVLKSDEELEKARKAAREQGLIE